MNRIIAAALALALAGSIAHSQSFDEFLVHNYVSPTPPTGDSSDRNATTAFVQGAVSPTFITCPASQWVKTIGASASVCAQPAFSDISGTATGITPGTYGSASQAAQCAFDASGRATSCANVPVNAVANDLNLNGEAIITIAGNTNDAVPSSGSLAGATNIFLSPTASGFTLTGITAPAGNAVYLVYNLSTNPITLSNESTASAAANRFSFGYDLVLNPAQVIVLKYQTAGPRWRLVNGGGYMAKGSALLVPQSQKNDRRVDVADYCSNSACSGDQTAAFNASIAQFVATGGGLLNVCGAYSVSAQIVVNGPGIEIAGCGRGAAVISATTLTQNVFVFNSTGLAQYTVRNVNIHDLTITSAGNALKTAGAGILMNSVFDSRIERVELQFQYIAIDLPLCGFVMVRQNGIDNAVSIGIRHYDPAGSTANGAVGVSMELNIINGTTHPVGIALYAGVNGDMLTRNQVLNCSPGLLVTTSNVASGGAISWLFFFQNQWDQNSIGAQFQASNTGIIEGIFATGEWYSTNSSQGLQLDASTGTLKAITLDHPVAYNNGAMGVQVIGVNGLIVDGAQMSGNSRTSSGTYSGLKIENTVSTHINIHGGIYGPVARFANTQKYGIEIAAAVHDYYNIVGVDAQGNVSGSILDGGTGTHKNVTLNF